MVVVPQAFGVKGKVLTLGQNIPQPGTRLKVMEVGENGMTGATAGECTTDEAGYFHLEGIKPYQPYMIYCEPPGARTIAYYFPRIHPHESLLYLRALPSAGMISMMLGGLPADSTQATVVLFSNQQAIVYPRDELEVNGQNLATSSLADAAKTPVAWFLYDGNKNQQSELSLMQPLSNFPFMRAVDMYLSPAESPLSIRFAGKNWQVPLTPSARAITIVVLQP
jgi:hypothetical protein